MLKSSDAHNLAHRIGRIYTAGDDVHRTLGLYHEERRPVAIRNALQSLKNGNKIFGLLKALKNTGPDIELARQQMYEALADHKQAGLITTLIEDQREHFDNVSLLCFYIVSGSVKLLLPVLTPADAPHRLRL